MEVVRSFNLNNRFEKKIIMFFKTFHIEKTMFVSYIDLSIVNESADCEQ